MPQPAPSSKSSAPPAIAVAGLCKVFRLGFRRRRVTALADASFEVPRGCVFGLVGPNGAGKTTTIKILMGLISASAGRASLLGHRVPSVASRRSVGYLPEQPHFYDHLTPTELLGYVGRLYGLTGRESRRRGRELLDIVGLGADLKKPIRKFSKGMMQRLGIAQTLLPDPDLVILDEPQSGLDPIGRKEVKDIIIDLGRRGRTVFFSSHILADVEDVSDLVAVMIKGRVRDIGHVDSLLNPRVVETQIEVSGVGDELAAGLRARALRTVELEGSLLLTYEGEAHNDEIVRAVIGAGGQIRRLVAHREDLEDLFVREARALEGESRQGRAA
jgi:ABC-2 type transport system ATP-binding protein